MGHILLKKKGARGKVNLNSFLLPEGGQEGKCYWPLLLSFTLGVSKHLVNVILASFFPKCVKLKTFYYHHCWKIICYSQQSATCFVSNNGLKVTVEDAKCVQANAFVQSGIFQEYIFKEESATFRINLNVLLVINFNVITLRLEKKSKCNIKICYVISYWT